MRQSGFSLLEVLIALSLLVIGMTALVGRKGIAIQASDYSNRLSQATFLAEGKLLDVEHTMVKDGMETFDDCEDGDFHDEGFRRFKWKACAYKLELEENAGEQITQQFLNAFAGLSGGLDVQNLDPRVAMQIQMFGGMIPSFLERLEDKIRKVKLEVTWRDAARERSMMLERYITVLGVDGQGMPPPPDGAITSPEQLIDPDTGQVINPHTGQAIMDPRTGRPLQIPGVNGPAGSGSGSGKRSGKGGGR